MRDHDHMDMPHHVNTHPSLYSRNRYPLYVALLVVEEQQSQATVGRWGLGLAGAQDWRSSPGEGVLDLAMVRIDLEGFLAIDAAVAVDGGFALTFHCREVVVVELKLLEEDDMMAVDIYWDMVPGEIAMLFQRSVSSILQMVLDTISTFINIT